MSTTTTKLVKENYATFLLAIHQNKLANKSHTWNYKLATPHQRCQINTGRSRCQSVVLWNSLQHNNAAHTTNLTLYLCKPFTPVYLLCAVHRSTNLIASHWHWHHMAWMLYGMVVWQAYRSVLIYSCADLHLSVDHSDRWSNRSHGLAYLSWRGKNLCFDMAKSVSLSLVAFINLTVAVVRRCRLKRNDI